MPVSPNSTSVLSWESMTAAINKIKSPNSFVRNLLFSAEDPKETKTIELSYIKRDRQTAPFVKRGAAAILIKGHTEEFAVVEPAHIRIKRNMEPTSLLNTRRAGTRIFVDAAEQRAAIDRYMATEIGHLATDIDETLEWMCAQALTGTISYSGINAAFEVVMPRSSSHSFDLTAGEHWDEAGDHVAEDFLLAMTLINDDESVNPTDVILGSEAAEWFMKNADVQALLKNNPNNAILTGNLTFVEQMTQAGALYLGAPFHNIRVWRYARKTSLDGTTVDLIRPKYAEFVTATPFAENVVYYGPIEDIPVFGEGGTFVSPRFAKQWTENDPPVRIALAESNPLPCLRKPDTTVSIKVVSG